MKIEIISPFKTKLNNQECEFEHLIKGYGAKNGMIIDSDYQLINKYKDLITENNYGYSCFELDINDKESLKEIIDDWKIV